MLKIGSALRSVGNWIGENLLGIAGGIGDFFSTQSVNKTNQAIANQNIAFQREENAITRQREDNAVQRAAADMQAAGLSKTLAAGNPASAQALTAPQNSYKPTKLDIINSMMQAQLLKSQIDKQKADIRSVDASTTGQNIANKYAEEGFKLDLASKGVKINLDKANLKLASIEGEYKAEQIRYDMSKAQAQIQNFNMDSAKKAQEIKVAVSQKYKLDKEGELLVEQIAYEQLKEEALRHDIDVAKSRGSRTTGDTGTWWERAIGRFNIANGNQSINLPQFTPEGLGY